jgi:hypothetical protein
MMKIYSVLFLILTFCLLLNYDVNAELLLHLDGDANGYGTPNASFVDKAKGHNAIPTNSSTGETGIGIVGNGLITSTADSAIGKTAIGMLTTSYSRAINIADGIADFDRSYSNFTVSLWYKPHLWSDSPDTDDNLIIGKCGATGDRGWQLSRKDDSSRIIFMYFDSPYGYSDTMEFTDAGVNPDKFTHIAITFSAGDSLRMYFNGVQVNAYTSYVLSAFNGINSKPLQIGNRGDNSSDSVDGTLDDIGIWDETISAQKIAAIYALGKFEDINLQSPDIDQFLTAFANHSKAVINCNVWQYTSGLTGVSGTTGGNVESCNAFVVLDDSGNGMKLSNCHTASSGDLNKDCKVDFADFAIMAAEWLDCNLEPASLCSEQ